jgi:glucosyl-dolichyl phosphate glucuronosyltransferase
VLCTYNRCDSLAQTLSSASALQLPDAVDWEILVVDNNSGDRTRLVVEDFCRRFPGRFRYLFEPQQGLCHARNAGIREARGDIIAFMDDDVTVEPTWLQNLTAALHNGKWAGAGGRVVPTWTCSPPQWLSLDARYAKGPLVMFDCGPVAHELSDPPFGANMAFRKQMFEKYGEFRSDLDRCGGSLISNGDTEFGSRLLEAGESLRYEPSAVVYHPVPEDRLNKNYFLAWWFGKGRSDIRQRGIPHDVIAIGGHALELLRCLAVHTLRWLGAVDPSRRFDDKLKVWEKLGEIKEWYCLSREAKTNFPPAENVVSRTAYGPRVKNIS